MKKNDDLKRIIQDVVYPLNEKLDTVIQDLDSIGGQLNHPKAGLKRINEKLDALWDQTVKLTIGAESIKEASKNQASSLNRTNDNIKRLDKRLRTIENHSGLVPPPELTLFE